MIREIIFFLQSLNISTHFHVIIQLKHVIFLNIYYKIWKRWKNLKWCWEQTAYNYENRIEIMIYLPCFLCVKKKCYSWLLVMTLLRAHFLISILTSQSSHVGVWSHFSFSIFVFIEESEALSTKRVVLHCIAS